MQKVLVHPVEDASIKALLVPHYVVISACSVW